MCHIFRMKRKTISKSMFFSYDDGPPHAIHTFELEQSKTKVVLSIVFILLILLTRNSNDFWIETFYELDIV